MTRLVQLFLTGVLVFLSAALPHAQQLPQARTTRAAVSSSPILDSARRVLAESAYTLESKPNAQAAAPSQRRSKTRIALGAAAGAAGGFFAGGYLGAKISGQCDCDDPGLLGAVIGAPIGAVAGGIAGGKWLF
jgi:hypothetical protein